MTWIRTLRSVVGLFLQSDVTRASVLLIINELVTCVKRQNCAYMCVVWQPSSSHAFSVSHCCVGMWHSSNYGVCARSSFNINNDIVYIICGLTCPGWNQSAQWLRSHLMWHAGLEGRSHVVKIKTAVGSVSSRMRCLQLARHTVACLIEVVRNMVWMHTFSSMHGFNLRVTRSQFGISHTGP